MPPKTAYLTIDDAPSPDMQPKLDALLEREIPAVLFCTGKDLDARPDMALYAIRHGFILGNHSYSHPYFSELSLPRCRAEIRRTDALIDKLYAQAGVARPVKFFRFPYGDKGGLQGPEVFAGYSEVGLVRKQRIQALLRELGYTQPAFEGVTYRYYHAAGLLEDVDWYWTYDCMDWALTVDDPPFDITSLDAVFARMEEHEPEAGRGLNFSGSEEIILMHDHVPTTPVFTAILDRLLAKDLHFASVL